MKQVLEIVAEDNRCGEAPIWDGACGRLIWTDISSNLVYQLVRRTGEKSVISEDLMVAGIALGRDGDLMLAGATGLYLSRGNGSRRPIVSEYRGESLFFNDIIADARGRIYAGTTYWGAGGLEKLGRLYLIDRDGTVRIVEDGIEHANGLGFSPDNKTLYFTDSTVRQIYAYDIDARTGDLSNRRSFVRVPDTEGIPDGLTVDKEGFVWSAQWYGAQVVRYDPDGAVERRIELPVTQVSSVAFGGDKLTDLYVTTAGDSWVSDYAPPGYDWNAANVGGSLYRIALDIEGKPEHLTDLTGAL